MNSSYLDLDNQQMNLNNNPSSSELMILDLKKENSTLRSSLDQARAKSELSENKKHYEQVALQQQQEVDRLKESLDIHSSSQQRVYNAKMEDLERLIATMKVERDNENAKKQRLEYQLTLAAKEAQNLADQTSQSKLLAEQKISELTAKVEDLTVQNSALEERLNLITEEARKKIEYLNNQVNQLNNNSNSQEQHSHLLLQYQSDFDQLRKDLQEARDDLNESASRLERSNQERMKLQDQVQLLTYQLNQSQMNNNMSNNNNLNGIDTHNQSDIENIIQRYEQTISELHQKIAAQATEKETFSWRISRMTEGLEDEIKQALSVLNGELNSVQIKWIIEDEKFTNVRKMMNYLLEKISNGNISDFTSTNNNNKNNYNNYSNNNLSSIQQQQQQQKQRITSSPYLTHDESYVPSITPPRKTLSRGSSFSSIPPSTPQQQPQQLNNNNIGTPSGISYSTPSRLDQPNFTIDRRGDNTYLSTIQEKDRSQIQMQVSRDGSVNMVITPPKTY